MTEQEWLEYEEPIPMLDLLSDRASDRKLRLFACLCCRQSWRRLSDKRSRQAVEVAERYADSQVSSQELKAAYRAAESARKEARTESQRGAAWVATLTAQPTYSPFGTNDLGLLAEWATGRATLQRSRQQCHWLRCLFGNPFRNVSIDPAWLLWNDGTVVKVGKGIYDEQAFDRLPILADGLEDAGCTNLDVLAHCRQQGEHVRGCWVVDLILGKK
jgi:hypothetical protein